MIRAVVFDMDGLLIDSEPLWQEAEVDVFRAVGAPISLAEAEATTGIRIDEVVALRERQFGGFRGASAAEVTARIVARVVELVATRGVAKPGVFAAIELVRARGCRIGLASSSPRVLIDAVLERLGLAGTFEATCSAEGLPLGKPHPEVFLSAAARLETAALDCLAIEDSISGCIAAKAARMVCLAVPDAHLVGDPRFAIADASIATLEDLDAALWARLGGG